MRRQEGYLNTSNFNSYGKEINETIIKIINQLYSSPEFKKISNAAQQLGGIANTPELKNLSIAVQQLGGITNTPEFKNLGNSTQQLGETIYRFYNSSAIQSISRMTQEISKSMYKESAVSTLEKILNINQNIINSTVKVTNTPAYQEMLLSFQESIAVSKNYNEMTSEFLSETQISIRPLLENLQMSELSLEELIENPYEEITSEDINDVLDKNSLCDILKQSNNKVAYYTSLLEDEAFMNGETRKKIDTLEKDGKKLLTTKEIIVFLISLLVSPIFQPFQEVYSEWASQPSTHLIKNIKKGVTEFYDEKDSYTNFRIVTKDNLKIKRGIRVDSETIGVLSLGDIVEVIDEKRNRTRIEINDDNDEITEGWVFTRYLEKLN